MPTSLSVSGLPQEQRPQIEMLDADQNQNGCRGSTLTLAYSGNAIG